MTATLGTLGTVEADTIRRKRRRRNPLNSPRKLRAQAGLAIETPPLHLRLHRATRRVANPIPRTAAPTGHAGVDTAGRRRPLEKPSERVKRSY
jgi:hypothetical protein